MQSTRPASATLLQALMDDVRASGLLSSLAQAVMTRHALAQGAQSAKATAADAARWVMLGLAAFVLAVIGAGLALAAGYIVLAQEFGAAISFALLAAAVWVTAGAIVLYSHRKSKPAAVALASGDGMEKFDEIAVEIKKLSAKHPFVMVAAAFGVGLILAQPNAAPAGRSGARDD